MIIDCINVKGTEIKTEEDIKSFEEEDVLQAFSKIRLALAQNFKLDHICFFVGNGCSIYAGAKPTTEFDLTNAATEKDLSAIKTVVDKIKDKSMEEQLNALLTVREFYHITGDKKEDIVATIINDIKKHLLKNYVNSVQYENLSSHEAMLMKLRSLGCLNKISVYTPNYDLAFEYMLDKLGIDYANGFVGFVNRKFDSKSLQIAKTAKLVKIHGSVNWVFDEKDKVVKEVQPHFMADEKDDIEHVLIYPTSQKLYQTYNAPYSELMRSMLDEFESRSNLIIVIGYKYGDEHINEILFKALANPNNIFYFFDYAKQDCDFIKRILEISESLPNINVLRGHLLGDFEVFVKYMLPANAEKTDGEQIFEFLSKVMEKHKEKNDA